MSRATRRCASKLLLITVAILMVTACAGQPPSPPAKTTESAPTAAPAAAKPVEAAKPAAARSRAGRDRRTGGSRRAGRGEAGREGEGFDRHRSVQHWRERHDARHGRVTGWVNEAFNIHEPLVKLVFNGDKVEYKPGIAESWKLVNDTTYEFKIRQGVKFHNGETVTANDVAYSLNRILDKENKLPALTYFQYFTEAKVTDPTTVVITTKEPHAPAIPRLTFLTSCRRSTSAKSATMGSRSSRSAPGCSSWWSGSRAIGSSSKRTRITTSARRRSRN